MMDLFLAFAPNLVLPFSVDTKYRLAAFSSASNVPVYDSFITSLRCAPKHQPDMDTLFPGKIFTADYRPGTQQRASPPSSGSVRILQVNLCCVTPNAKAHFGERIVGGRSEVDCVCACLLQWNIERGYELDKVRSLATQRAQQAGFQAIP